MSTLYTMVSESGKKDIIVLNRNYTNEQLREKLSADPGVHTENWIDHVLTNGVRIPEGETITVKIRDDATITTQCYGSIEYCYKGYKVILYPNGDFEKIPSMKEKAIEATCSVLEAPFRMIEYAIKALRNHFSDPGDQKGRER